MSDLLFKKFIEACSAGDTNKFHEIISSDSIVNADDLIAFNDYACFHLAAANGHSDVVKAVIDYVESVSDEMPCEEAVIPVFQARDGEGFKAALINHHMKTAKLILEQEYLFSDCMTIIENNSEFFKIIWNSSLRNCILYIFSNVCGQDISLVRKVLDDIPHSSRHLLLEQIDEKFTTQNFTAHIRNPFTTACDNGKLEILQLLWSLVSPSYQDRLVKFEFPASYIVAVKNGRLDILKQLFEWVIADEKTSFLIFEDFCGFIYAADRGYIEILKFIWANLPDSLQSEAVSASNFAAYRLARFNQHHNVIDFLESHNTQETIKKMKNAINQSATSRSGE